jgi:hypothetical protein
VPTDPGCPISERALCARCGIPRTSTDRPKNASRLGVSTRAERLQVELCLTSAVYCATFSVMIMPALTR